MSEMIRYARGRDKFDTQPEIRTAESFRAFVRDILEDRGTRKGEQWFAAPFNSDGRRCRENAQARRFLPVDLDHIAADRLADVRLWFTRFRGFGYPTASSTAEAPRERVVIELDREASRDECVQVGAALARDLVDEFGDAIKVDQSVFRNEQPVFTPLHGAAHNFYVGDPLAVEPWLARAPKPEEDAPRGARQNCDTDELSRIRSALRYCGSADDYDTWLAVGMELHAGSAGSEQGFGLWCEWAEQSAKFDMRRSRAKWATFHDDGGRNLGSLFLRAKANGWSEPRRRAERHAKGPEGMDANPGRESAAESREEARDAAFRELSKRIGDASDIEPGDLLPRLWTLDEMLAEFVFLGDGAQVALRGDPRTAVAFGHFELRTAASVRKIPSGNPRLVARYWLEHPRRVTVHTLTFAPGAPEICRSPDDHIALNLWRPGPPIEAPENWPEHAGEFLRHLCYLAPLDEERGLFLDWLAHLEQRPGELPHFHYFFIANTHGIGRNLLSAWLARVWRGYVALGVDLPALTAGGFNGCLSRKLLAQVDELNEVATADRGSIYRAAEALKSLLTRERTLINPKYGRQHVEFNAMRWLMFSNHDSALYLDERDRRFCVVRNPDTPKSADYYAEMYRRCDDPGFIASVRKLLAERDISTFNPGKLPAVNQAKADVIAAGRSDIDQAMLELAAWWPGEVVTATDIRRFVFPGVDDDEREARRESGALRHAAGRAGMRPLDRRIRIGGKLERVWTLRNPDTWAIAKPGKVASAIVEARCSARQKESSEAANERA